MGEKEKELGAMSKILILHGWAYSTEKWKTFVRILSDNGFNAQLLKIPGLTEKLESVWNIDNYTEWLNGIIEKGEKVILIGHSNGGRILLAFAAKYPEKIKYLVLIDSAGIYHNDLPIRLKRFIFKSLAGMGKKVTRSESLRKLLYRLARESDYEKAPPFVKQTMVNLINFDVTESLNKVKTPTLIIWGKNDKTTPFADGKLMHKLIKNSKLQVIQSAKHSPQFTHVNEVIQIILKEIT